jgi:hypothetical protein
MMAAVASFNRLAGALLVLACLALAGCAPALVQVLQQDPGDPERYVRVTGPGAVTVFRDGRAFSPSTPQALHPGDAIQTGPEAAAIVRLPEGHEIVLDENTRVRLGSFIVEFGRLLARARGFFEVESENVIAGVEGTEFVFEVPRERSTSVTVLQGKVVCRSRDRQWPPLYLAPGERFHIPYPEAPRPEKRPATREEIADIERWVAKVDASRPPPPRPPLMGYCCSNGRVLPATRERCNGRYFSEAATARLFCRPPREEGYCCLRGRIYPSTQDRCPGSFHPDAERARRACQLR